MRHLRIGVLELVAGGSNRSLYARTMFPNFASVMPQVVAVWCEQLGHGVSYEVYTGTGEVPRLLPDRLDVVFLCAFTHAALLAYAASNLFRSRGSVTVLGGPHARAFPEHARRHFDYVLGLTDRELLRGLLEGCEKQRPLGMRLAAMRQPETLPGARERWRFIRQLQARTVLPSTPMLASLGCPYTCEFCVDATVPYQSLDLDQLADDLRFLAQQKGRARVVWHDPNFGVRFDACLNAIESAVAPGSMDFIAESSLSLLNKARLQRLASMGFRAMLPGIESWNEFGNKSGVKNLVGARRLESVIQQVRLILEYIPYVQANFVFGLDSDEGEGPFDMTREFIEKVPGAFPACALLTAYGESTPLAGDLARSGRVLPVPFPFLYSGFISNVRPKHYSWSGFYERLASLIEFAFAGRIVARRLRDTKHATARVVNLIRTFSAEGRGRAAMLRRFRMSLETDVALRDFMEGETTRIPASMMKQLLHDLGDMRDWLPPGSIEYDASTAATGSIAVATLRFAGRSKGTPAPRSDSDATPAQEEPS